MRRYGYTKKKPIKRALRRVGQISAHGFDPVECDRIKSETNKMVAEVLDAHPELAASKFIGPMLKTAIYTHLPISDANRIALFSTEVAGLIDALVPVTAKEISKAFKLESGKENSK